MIKFLQKAGFCVLLSCLSTAIFAQGKVKGIITDAKKVTMPGASVAIAGTTVGTISSLDGEFVLSVPSGSVDLVISFVGYTTQNMTVNVVANETKDLGTIVLATDDVLMDDISIIANIAIDRHTPVAISTIKPELISEKLSSKEFPEILKSTPGVYATRQGGGFGDSRINVRGFDMRNTAVLVNGIPVNDMENGWVYMSNWAGLSEVTRDIQVQRGLGASKLSIGSVGGTINYITKASDNEAGGSVFTGVGSDGYKKTAFTVSTGLLDNGWAVTASGARNVGVGWADATQFETWSYFLNISKRWASQSLSFTAFGAPQTHGQRRSKQTIATIQNPNNGLRWNPDWGYKDGQLLNLNDNFYHKPQMSLNHFLEISEKTKLVSSAYVSFGTGGGTGDYGSEKSKFFDNDYKVNGQIDYDRIVAENVANGTAGSSAILRSSRNDHNWYGLLSNVQHKLNDVIELSGGLDLRYYQGRHFREVVDLLGGDFIVDKYNVNKPMNIARVGDKINYNNDGEVNWAGLFAQAEYSKDELSGFLSGSFSNTGYRRTDYFHYLDSDSDRQSKWVNHQGFVVKGGANYNINALHNVFANAGYFERAPFFDAVFFDYNSNAINEGVKNEKVLSFELGYGFRSQSFTANVNGYYTDWKDKFLRKTLVSPDGSTTNANLSGVDALHMGLEFDFVWKPIEKVEVTGMVSLGDYKWKNNLTGVVLYDDEQVAIDTVNIYMKDLKVGDAAQTTMALGANYEILEGLKIGADFNFFDNYFAQFDPTGRTSADQEGVQAWKAPTYSIIDLNVRYQFTIAGLETSVFANINNLLDTEYISDADDGKNNDWQTARVFYGIGRTWTTGLKINF